MDVVVFAVGNPSRGDDAIGPRLMAELEAAVNAASGPKVSANAEPIGQVDGRVILVSKADSDQTIGELLGTFDKSGARRVRKLMRSAGYVRFAALPRLVGGKLAAKAA